MTKCTYLYTARVRSARAVVYARFDASRRGKEMLNSSHDKKEGAHRAAVPNV